MASRVYTYPYATCKRVCNMLRQQQPNQTHITIQSHSSESKKATWPDIPDTGCGKSMSIMKYSVYSTIWPVMSVLHEDFPPGGKQDSFSINKTNNILASEWSRWRTNMAPPNSYTRSQYWSIKAQFQPIWPVRRSTAVDILRRHWELQTMASYTYQYAHMHTYT